MKKYLALKKTNSVALVRTRTIPCPYRDRNPDDRACRLITTMTIVSVWLMQLRVVKWSNFKRNHSIPSLKLSSAINKMKLIVTLDREGKTCL